MPTATASIGCGVTSRKQLVERFLVVRLGEEIDDSADRRGADAVDGVELGARFEIRRGFARALPQRVERAEMAGEAPRVGLADMADAERVEEAVERRTCRRASIAANRLRAEVSPKPSRSASVVARLARRAARA